MRAVILIVVIAVVAGLGLGISLAYIETGTAADPAEFAASLREPASDGTTADDELPAGLPRAEVPETFYNFGNMEHNTSMSHTFVVRNVGDVPLRVEEKSTTCKCTVGNVSNNEVAPGEEAEVTLEWVAKSAPGPFRHGATLATNDPKHSRIELTIEGQVVESTAMYPSELVFGTIRAGEEKTAELYLMSFLSDEVEVLDYEISESEVAEHVAVEITPVDRSELPSSEAKAGVKVTAVYKSGETLGPIRGDLKLTTTLKNAQNLTIPLLGRVVGDISIFGPGWNAHQGILRMGSFTSETEKEVRLNLSVRGEEASDVEFQVESVEPDELEVRLGEPHHINEQLTHVPLTVRVPEGTEPMVRLGGPISEEGEIRLSSNHSKTPNVRLRVQFAVE